MGTIELIIATAPGVLGLGAAVYFAVTAVTRGKELSQEKDRTFAERELRVVSEKESARLTIENTSLTQENARLKGALVIAERAALAAEAEEVRRVEEDPDRSAAHVGAAVDNLLSTPLPGAD